MIIYNLIIFCYRLGISIAAIFNTKAKQWISGRKNLLRRIQNVTKNENQPIIWMHAASLGEFEQARPLIEYIKKTHPKNKIFLSFFSPSGYNLRKDYTYADYVFYLPLDTKKNAKLFLAYVKPRLVFFIKYEYWYHYLTQLKKNNIPTYLVSAIFRKNQLFFKPWWGFYKTFLRNFSHIFVQNETSKLLLQTIDYKDVSVTGDTRFDTVSKLVDRAQDFIEIEKFKQGKITLICGSTWWADEKHILRWINSSDLALKYIIAPHEISPKHIRKITSRLQKKYVLLSEIKDNPSDVPVLIVDSIGLLASIYRYGDVAYIGGGFGRGIHNILEPAAWGLPVIFGPKYKKFQEAKDLLARKCVFSYKTYDELKNILNNFFLGSELHKIAGESAKNYVLKNTGSAKKIIKNIDYFIFICILALQYLKFFMV